MVNNQMNKESYSLLGKERVELIQILNSMPSSQLDELIVAVNPPGEVIPPNNAAQGDRTAALIRWAEGTGGKGLQEIQKLLEEIIKDDRRLLALNHKTYKFIDFLSSLKEDENLKKEISALLARSGFPEKYNDHRQEILDDDAKLRLTLIEEKLHCTFLSKLYIYLDGLPNKKEDFIRKLEELGEVFECNLKELLSGGSGCSGEAESSLYYLVIQVNDCLSVQAFLCSENPNKMPKPIGSPLTIEGIDDLREEVDKLIREAEDQNLLGLNESYTLAIEILLPLNYLLQDTDRWKIKDEFGEDSDDELGEKYPVILRSHDRKIRARLKQSLIRVWENKFYSPPKDFSFIHQLTTLDNEVEQQLRNSLIDGLPFILLIRCDLSEPNLKGKELLDDLEDNLREAWRVGIDNSSDQDTLSSNLVRIVHQDIYKIRKIAFQEQKDKNSHIGYHISILCDPKPPCRFQLEASKTLSDETYRGRN